MKSQFYPPMGSTIPQYSTQPMNVQYQQSMPNMLQSMGMGTQGSIYPPPPPPSLSMNTQQASWQSAPQIPIHQVVKQSRVNWRNVNDLDIDEVRKSNDIETLESYLPNLLDASVSQEEYEKLKPEALVKLLQICQMSLQYFDYTQDYLESLSNETNDEITKLEKKADDDKVALRKSKKEIEKMKHDISVKKEAMKKYKDFIRQRPQFKCHICLDKFFQNEEYLDGHMKRRHLNVLPMNANHPNFAVMQNMVFAQQLKQQQQEFERHQNLLQDTDQSNKDVMLDKFEKVLQKEREEHMQGQLQMGRKLFEMEQQQANFLMSKDAERQNQMQYISGLANNMSNIHNVQTMKDRDLAVPAGPKHPHATAIAVENRSKSELNSKQNELLEAQRRLQQDQQQLEFEKKLRDIQRQEQELVKRELEIKEREIQYKELAMQQAMMQAQRQQQQNQQKQQQLQTQHKPVVAINSGKRQMQQALTREELIARRLISEEKLFEESLDSQFTSSRPPANPLSQNSSRIPHEIKQATLLISEIPRKHQQSRDLAKEIIEDIDVDDIYSGRHLPVQRQQSRKSEDNQVSNQANKYNNILMEDRSEVNLNNEQVEEDIQVDTHAASDIDIQLSNSSMTSDATDDREYNAAIEKEKEKMDMLSNEQQQDMQKARQLQGLLPFESDNESRKKNKHTVKGQGSRKSKDFSDDEFSSSAKNQHEESSGNQFDGSGFYNGSKGVTQDLQANPNSLKIGSVSIGDSYSEQLYSQKMQAKNRKKFNFEDSYEFN